MNYIKLLAELGQKEITEKNKEINVLLSEKAVRVINVNLSNREVLAKHSTPSPITVLCLSGKGVFKAGENLEQEQKLTFGTLIYLGKGVLHEVAADPELRILVTKFSE